MHFGRRPRVYSYFKNMSGLSFCYYFNVTSDEVTVACWVPKQKETFLENRVFFSKRNVEFLWSASFLTTAGTLLAHFLSLFKKKKEKEN